MECGGECVCGDSLQSFAGGDGGDMYSIQVNNIQDSNMHHTSYIHHHVQKREDTIDDLERNVENLDAPGDYLEDYRSDTLNDINAGLNVIATGIKVITTILALFGADNTDRLACFFMGVMFCTFHYNRLVRLGYLASSDKLVSLD